MHHKKNNRGLARLIAAWRHSRTGLRDAWREEEAFRLEAVLFVLSIPLAAWLSVSVSQFGLMVGSLLLLMVVEILNSAIEAVVDRVGLDEHELSRLAKDLGSAAVLLAALFPAFIWGALLLERTGLIAL
jgi:diacylglycerol kinase (ATP)